MTERYEEILNKLQELNTQRGALYKELERSAALKNLWPEVFDGEGKVTSQMRTNRKGFVALKVTGATGEVREFTDTVPECLKYEV